MSELPKRFSVDSAATVQITPPDIVRRRVSAPAIGDAADKFMAIAANQGARRAALRSSYDHIVVGSGASGSVVARRLAENQDAQVLLLEAGGEDLKPGILITETWFFNQGGEFDWNFAAEHVIQGLALLGGCCLLGDLVVSAVEIVDVNGFVLLLRRRLIPAPQTACLGG